MLRPTKLYALNSGCVLISDMRLTMRKYGIFRGITQYGIFKKNSESTTVNLHHSESFPIKFFKFILGSAYDCTYLRMVIL